MYMLLYNILDQIVDILLYYYSNVRCTEPNSSVYEFLKYHLLQRINIYKYNTDEISSITVSLDTYNDLVVDNLDNISVYCIKQYIATNINDTSIRMDNYLEFNISLNVCPFEGLTIDSSFVISVCDCMMY